jgi:hypothetical protein
MAEQRFELGKVLGEIARDAAAMATFPETEVEFEMDPSPAMVDRKFQSLGTPAEPKELLKIMAEIETADHELLAAAAGAVLSLSSVMAERLAGEAASARKRSNWAQDHLDLLGMG